MPYPNQSLDDFRPFTGPYMRAQEMASYVEDLKFKREARDHEREQWRINQEQLKRTNAMQDYMTRMALHQMGAAPLMEGEPGTSYAEKMGQTAMDTPVGRVALPSMEQQAQTQGTLAGIKTRATEEVTDPYVETDLGPQMGGKVMVPKRSVADIKIRAYDKLNPDLVKTELPPNDAGDVTVLWHDKQGNEMKRFVYTGAGKTARAGASGKYTKADAEAEVNADFHPQRERRIGEMMPWAYAQLGVPPDSALPEEAAKARKLAEEHVDHAIKEEFNTRVGQKMVERRQQPGSQIDTSQTGQSLKGYSISAKNVAAAAKAKNLTPEEFSRQWNAAGGTITP